MKKLVLIDGNSLVNRAFHATPLFTTKDGMPTNAIYGFTKLLLKIIEDNSPDYLLAAFDRKAPTFRHGMYTEYKATRKGMPDELTAQIGPLKDLLRTMNIAMYEQDGLEADDIMGTLSAKFDVHSYIYTGDRDAYQLVDDKTDVYFTVRGVSELKKLDINNFREEIHLEPSQIIDIKALMGDTSDNIPGVPGIGEKTAYTLVDTYGTLDNIYENLPQIKGAAAKKLADGKESAYLSYSLATIKRDCDIGMNLDDMVCPKKFGYDARVMFSELEFKTFLTMDIFGEEENTGIERNISYPEKIRVTDAKTVINAAKKADTLCASLTEDILQLYDGKKLYEISSSNSLLGLSPEEYTDILAKIFSDATNHVIMYDCKAAMHILDTYGVEFLCDYDDVSVMGYLTDTIDSPDIGKACDENLLDSSFAAYAVHYLWSVTVPPLEDDIKSLYTDIEKPLVRVLFEMEKEGITMSRENLTQLGEKYTAKINELTAEIYRLCGTEFNINSPTQLGDVLFNRLGLKSGKKNKRGSYSTDAETLEGLAEESEAVRDVLKFRQYKKLYSTYIEGFRPCITGDGKIHTTYNQTVTSTGRLSSTNPNMQNIPVRDDEGREIRKMFTAGDGHVLIDADYSQIELRLLAHFSECPALIDAYNRGEDIHTVTAMKMFGVEKDEITPKMRRDAKAVNFGIIYGISEYGLSKNLNSTIATARQYIDNYFESYKEVRTYIDSNVEFAKENGYVRTLTGRKRIIPEIKSSNRSTRQFGERAAMNMPLQGTSADIIKIAMVNVNRALKRHGLKTKMILQVHDELVLESPDEEAEEAKEVLKYEMENAVQLKVPLTVELSVGKNWYETK